MDKKPDLLDAFIYGPNADKIKVECKDEILVFDNMEEY